MRTHACCRLGSPSGPPPPQHAWARGGVCTQLKSTPHPPRGASPRASVRAGPLVLHARTERADAPPPSVRGKPACGCTRTGGSTNRERYHVSGEAPEYLPAGLGRVTLLHSGRHTRSVHEGAGRGFALTQHAHIVIIAVLYTRTTVALALPQAPSHTRRSSPFQGPTAACACPKKPLPKGVLIQSSAVASSRTSGTPTRTPADRVSQALSAGAYACRPLSLLCQQCQLQSPIPRDIKTYTRFLFPNHIIRAA